MSDLTVIYKELLASGEGDILVKLKDGKQMKIISFLIKKRSPVFKTMLEACMREATTGVVDLSSQYSLEAFRVFMAYIYYNELYSGSYVPLLFEILSITDYYQVDTYRTYISDQIKKLITNVPICLLIAAEALKHGTLTAPIYARCLELLVEAVKPHVCYDERSGDSKAWCCSSHSKKDKRGYDSYTYTMNEQVACIYSTTRKNQGYQVRQSSEYTARCCMHGPRKQELENISQLPDFIVDDVNSAMMP